MKKPRGRPPHNDVLTPAEWRVVNAVRHGLKNQEIAIRENISLDGVKYHVANAIAKLELRNRKALRHWAGSPIESPLTSMENIMTEANNIQSLGQVARTVDSIEASEAWYKKVLQLTHLFTFGQIAFFDLSGTRLMLNQTDKVNTSESILYFKVPDINAAYSNMQRQDVHFINAPHMIHQHDDGSEEWMVFFEDLEKRPLALMSTVKH